MRVKTGNGSYLEARAKAEALESVVTTNYYTQLPQIRLCDFTGRSVQPETTAEVMPDDDDVSNISWSNGRSGILPRICALLCCGDLEPPAARSREALVEARCIPPGAE
jgi:hypothetical protein